jgi:acyl-CoA synthetase (AMP-forming)/AMP-acid ligase II
MNVAQFVQIPASLFPDQEILVFENRRYTYGELWNLVGRLAAGLEDAGVRRGEVVAVLDTNSDLYVAWLYASALVGATFLPLNYRAKLPELEYMIEHAGVKALAVGERYIPLFEQLALGPALPPIRVALAERASMPSWQSLVAARVREEPAPVEDEDTAVLMYTSGTTARPKAVLLTHGDFTAYVTANVELADGTPRGTALICAPFYHIAGATSLMSNAWTGRRMVLLPQFDARSWLAAVSRERVTHAFVVPTMLKQILDHPEFAKADLSSLQSLAYGGAPMPFPVIRRAIESFPRSVGFVNAFGQTETTSTLTVLGPEDHRLDGSPEEVEQRLRRLRSIGKPLPDVELRVVGDNGEELRPGEIGELWVRTPRVMKGYRGPQGIESPLERDGWLPTRDLGWIDEEGYVFLAGRKDDMIIRGGENIAPAEVENVLLSHPAVEEVAVVGIPDVEWGQRVAAFVVLRSGATASRDELIEFCRARLASFKRPEVVEFVPELPKNPLGKVLKRELRERVARAERVD